MLKTGRIKPLLDFIVRTRKKLIVYCQPEIIVNPIFHKKNAKAFMVACCTFSFFL